MAFHKILSLLLLYDFGKSGFYFCLFFELTGLHVQCTFLFERDSHVLLSSMPKIDDVHQRAKGQNIVLAYLENKSTMYLLTHLARCRLWKKPLGGCGQLMVRISI